MAIVDSSSPIGLIRGLQIGGIDYKIDYASLANKPDTQYVVDTMYGDQWIGSMYSFESIYPASSNDIEISLDDSATTEQIEAFGEAMICGSHDSNVVTAKGTVPGIDIPIIIKVVSK